MGTEASLLFCQWFLEHNHTADFFFVPLSLCSRSVLCPGETSSQNPHTDNSIDPHGSQRRSQNMLWSLFLCGGSSPRLHNLSLLVFAVVVVVVTCSPVTLDAAPQALPGCQATLGNLTLCDLQDSSGDVKITWLSFSPPLQPSHVEMNTYMCIYIYVCVCVCVLACVHVWVYCL